MKLSKAAVFSLCLTGVFLACAAGYLLGLRSGAAPYRVTTERPPDDPPAARSPALPSEKINVNTADLATLQLLPGVGEVRAAEIIAEREANGPFAAPEDLTRVKGIGEATMLALLDYVSVE